MPVYRIVYVDDESFRPRTLTAEFPSRQAAEAAMAQHGHRIAHIAEMTLGERLDDPILVPMASGPVASGARASGHIASQPMSASAIASRAVASFSRGRRALPASANPMILGLPTYDLAALVVVIAGAAMAGAAVLFF